MKSLKPIHAATRVQTRTREWLPNSAETLFAELESIKERASKDGRLLLYRGHRCREWRLDSTFVRSVKMKMFGMQAHDGFSSRLQDSGDLNSALTSLLLFKFGTLLAPSDELNKAESDHNLDAWFELMKRYQQYPEDDIPAPAYQWGQTRSIQDSCR